MRDGGEHLRLIAAFFLAITLVAPTARAQPSAPQPVRVIVPNPAGGTGDLLARLLARGMQAQTGASVIVENRPGAAGLTAAAFVSRAAPDGATLFMTNEGPVTILPAFRKETPYDPATFSAISMGISMPFYMIVNARLGVRNVADFIALTKSRAEPLYYGSTGVGGPSHLLTEQFAAQTGARLKHIPYQGGPQALASLLAGETDLFFSVPSTALAQMKAKETAFIGVTSRTRTIDAPDVATFGEQGIDGFEAGAWFGLFGPPGMSDAAREKARDIMALAFDDPEARAVIAKLGAQRIADRPAEFQKTVLSDLARWRDLSTRLKLTLD